MKEMTPASIFDEACPECGHPLYITYRHIGGHAMGVPYVACANPNGGEAHLLVRISDELDREYRALLQEIDIVNDVWARQLEQEVTK